MPDSSKMITILISIIGGLVAASGGFTCAMAPDVPTILLGVLIAISGGTISFVSGQLENKNIVRGIIGLNGGLVAGIGGNLAGIFAGLLLWPGIVIGILVAVAGGLVALISFSLAQKEKDK